MTQSEAPLTQPMGNKGIPLKYKIIALLVSLATAFAFGRYTVPEKIKIEKQIVEVEKKTETESTDKRLHKKIKKTIVKKPDGTTESSTTITYDSDDKKDTKQSDQLAKSVDEKKEVTKQGSPVTISALAGVNVTSPSSGIVYGASVTKPILGPVTVGGFGLSNGTAGGSVGLTF